MSTRKNQFRSLSPSGRFCSSSISTNPTRILTRPTSPTRVTISHSPSFRLTGIASSATKNHNISHRFPNNSNNNKKKKCACSPTTHPGSYRCSLHKGSSSSSSPSLSSFRSSHQLNMRRSAMTNSLVRIGTVEGELVKRALAALIRPSSHSLKRRFDFQPRKSRLSVMTKADEI